MSTIGGQPREVVQRYVLDASNYKKGIQDVAKLIRAQEKHEKNLALVRKNLDGQTKKLTKSTKALSHMSRAAAHATGTLMAGALSRLTRAMGSALKMGLDYEDWVGRDAAAIKKLSTATAGLVPTLELARARTRLTTGDFKLNEQQIIAVTKAAVKMTRVYKTDFNRSLAKVTDTIKTGSSKAFKELGFKMDLLGTATEKTDTAIKLITERFGNMNVAAENTNERLAQTKNKLDDMIAGTIAGVTGSTKFRIAISSLNDQLRYLALGLFGVSVRLNELTDTFGGQGRVSLGKWGLNAKAGMMAYGKELDRTIGKQVAVSDKLKALRAARAGRSGGKRPGGAGGKRSTGPSLGLDRDTSGLLGTDVGQTDRYYDPGMQAGAMSEMASALSATTEQWLIQRDAINQQREATARANDTMLNASNDMSTIGLNALNSFAAGTWAAADAAIQSGSSVGVAMAKMLKSTLLSIAQQSTVKAIFNLAEAAAQWFNPVAVSSHLSAAALYTGAAVLAGGAGLGISAATAKPSGASAGATASSTSSSASARPTFGRRVDKQETTVVINNYYGPQKSRAAALMAFKEIQTTVQQDSR